MKLIHFVFCAAFFLPIYSTAQISNPDYADQALVSAFSRDSGNIICAPKTSHAEMRELFMPWIQGIDLKNEKSYPALARAVYAAFPCPFSPVRPELRLATRTEIVGDWISPPATIRLQHGPRSPIWTSNPTMPPLKCEAVSFEDSGAYLVAQIMGDRTCPDKAFMQLLHSFPKVEFWSIQPNERLKTTRTDIPTYTTEWEIYSVKTAFEFSSYKFLPGELLAYERFEPGNQLNAVYLFRHLQPIK